MAKRGRASTGLLAAVAIAGCQAIGAPVEAPDDRYTIRGQVVWDDADRQTQATIRDIALASTVSLIDISDPSFNKTVASTTTSPEGKFNLQIGKFAPGADPYLLEALKGLNNNSPKFDAARIRTFIQFKFGWLSITKPGMTISPGTTALSVIYGLRVGTQNPTGAAATFINSLVEPGSTFTPGATKVTVEEFTALRALVVNSLNADNDPVHVVKFDPATGLYELDLFNAPVINFISPPMGGVGTTVHIVGERFEANPADNKVTFNGVAASVLAGTPTALTVKVPAGATTGDVRVVNPNGGKDTFPFQVSPQMVGTFKIW